MKLGAEKRGEVIALVVLLAVAGLLLWRSLSSSGSGVPAPVAPTATATPAANATAAAGGYNLDPRLHLDQLTALREHTYSGHGRNLFRFGAAPPPPPSAASLAAQRRAADAAQRLAASTRPLGPPPPPPIPLKFYGFALASNAPEKIFLQFGQDSFVAQTGEVIAHRYRIEAIGKLSVRVKDLMTQSVQEIPLQRPASGE